MDNKDLELGYKVHSLVEQGENWRLLGDSYQQSIYYGRFFNLLCMMEHIDVVLKWYRRLIPSMYYPNPQGLRDLLQALDTDSRLDLLPTIWKACALDVKSVFDGDRGRHSLEWSTSALSHITSLLLRANKSQQA
ncbi:hypothetical protein FQN60_010494, partial [Etheostoma spectabile]